MRFSHIWRTLKQVDVDRVGKCDRSLCNRAMPTHHQPTTVSNTATQRNNAPTAPTWQKKHPDSNSNHANLLERFALFCTQPPDLLSFLLPLLLSSPALVSYSTGTEVARSTIIEANLLHVSIFNTSTSSQFMHDSKQKYTLTRHRS